MCRYFPLSHTRRYIQRTEGKAEGTERNANNPASLLLGTQADFDFDAYAELTFADVSAFQAFFDLLQQPEDAARLAMDEEKFLDRSKSKISPCVVQRSNMLEYSRALGTAASPYYEKSKMKAA